MPTIAAAYLESRTLTSSPEQLHLMVVDAAIRFARAGEAALEENNCEAAFFALDRSRSCVGEILSGIQSDPNPELADRLKALFVYVLANLTRADAERNPQLVRDALRILESHRQTWGTLMQTLVNKRSSGARSDRPVGETSWTT